MKRGVNSKLNFSGVPKTVAIKKVHHEEASVEHLDTLSDTQVPRKAYAVGPTDAIADVAPPPVSRSSVGEGALAGLSVGAAAVFLLLRTIL
jgi:hypothetical protein